MSTGSCAVCQKPSDLQCARCHVVSYCGKEHERENWAKHQRTNCLAYKVKSFDDARYVVATRDIKKDEVILTEAPLALGPQQDSCPGCFRFLPDNKIYIRCPRCKWPVCSRKCSGLTDPLFHGAECEILCAIKSSFVIHSRKALLPLRCLLLQKNDPKKWQVVYELARQADEISLKRSKGEGYFFLEDAVFKPLAAKSPKLLPPNRSALILRRIFSLVESFGVRLKHPQRDGIVAVLAVTSLMEHSCMPNTRLAFVDPSERNDGSQRRCQVVVRAAQDIYKGEDITTSFVDVFQTSLHRQQILMTRRGDICYCDRCMDPTELGTNIGTFKCEDCSGPVLPIDPEEILDTEWECEGSCGKSFTPDDILKKSKLFFEVRREFSPDQEMFQLLEKMRAKVDKHLHPHNLVFLLIKMKTVQSCAKRIENDLILTSELQEGAEYCRDLLGVLLHPCLIDETYGYVADALLSLSQINSEIAKRKLFKKEMDSTGAELAKKYCTELKLLSTRFSNADYSDSDLESLRGNDIRLSTV